MTSFTASGVPLTMIELVRDTGVILTLIVSGSASRSASATSSARAFCSVTETMLASSRSGSTSSCAMSASMCSN